VRPSQQLKQKETRHAWQSLAYSPLDAVVSPNANKTHLLTDRRLPSSSASYWTYLKSPQKNFPRRLYNFLCLKLWGHWTESNQISTLCTEVIANYYAGIKIAFLKATVMNEDRRQIAGESRQKLRVLTPKTTIIMDASSPNCQYCHLIFWKRVYYRPIRCRTSKRGVKVVAGDVCNHPLNFTGCHSNVPWATGLNNLLK